jgi:hypothetical protein
MSKLKKLCTFKNCTKPLRTKQYCRGHQNQKNKGVDLKPLRDRINNLGFKCSFKDCSRDSKIKRFCYTHYQQSITRGKKLTKIKNIKPSGSGHLSKEGYVIIVIHGKHIKQHRFIMEDFLGRKLHKDEYVHHKNGIRSDNRIENLELWSSSQPKGQRVEDKIEWAKEMLDRYHAKID